jgi:hypothetical protein
MEAYNSAFYAVADLVIFDNLAYFRPASTLATDHGKGHKSTSSPTKLNKKLGWPTRSLQQLYSCFLFALVLFLRAAALMQCPEQHPTPSVPRLKGRFTTGGGSLVIPPLNLPSTQFALSFFTQVGSMGF